MIMRLPFLIHTYSAPQRGRRPGETHTELTRCDPQQVYGQMLVAQEEVESARERLEGARAIFQPLGAHRDLEQTEQLLAACRG